MAFKKITKRWLLNSFCVILFILVSIVIIFSFGIQGFYYNAVKQAILSRANSISTLLSQYATDSSMDFSDQVKTLVEDFEDKNRMELMALDTNGRATITSSGFEPSENITQLPDFRDAMVSGRGEFTGNVDGEKIMSITVASPVEDENLAAMRFVVSLTLVDQQIITCIIIITVVSLAVLFFVILSSSYFINSIVIPVGDIGKTARRIALGDFNTRLTKKNDDEIGELCDVINYMAGELANAEKMKNDFISSVSHELRTPLTAIKGWGETLDTEETVDPETLHKGMRVIIGETERLSGMVEELLDFSRMQSGGFTLTLDKLDILAEVEDVILMFTERAKREGIDLIYSEPDFFAVVNGDKNRLRQVFINVIDNALKYSDHGGKVTITAKLSGNRFVLSVADTGCGIKEEDLPKIKTKFYKANLTRRGSGIGLAVADEIVRKHGGTIQIKSTEGVGTTVAISIPLAK